jgi:hypothetical protein
VADAEGAAQEKFLFGKRILVDLPIASTIKRI